MGLCNCAYREPTTKPVQAILPCSQEFQRPAKPIGAASGSARTYRLVPLSDENVPSKLPSDDCCLGEDEVDRWRWASGEMWLGRDATGTVDELEFYDTALRLTDRRSDSLENEWRVFDYLVPYHGLLRGHVCSAPGEFKGHAGQFRERAMDLLVFKSPLQGLARPRLLQLEVGPRTTALQQRRGSDEEMAMFARSEGLSIEGFLAPPQSIVHEEPSYDVRGWTWGENAQKRAKRSALQRLSLGSALASFVDVRNAIAEERLWPSESTSGYRAFTGKACDVFLAEYLGPAEYSELVLLAFVRELRSLLQACSDVPMAQKWVGSSLGLFVEVGAAPPRSSDIDPREWVDARVRLKLFGWSRSRVSCTLGGQYISIVEQQDNEMHWQIYQDSITWILWEASRLYFRTFCVREWTELEVYVFEVNACGEERFVGVAAAGLGREAVGRQTIALTGKTGEGSLRGIDGTVSTLTLVVSYVECPSPSRFAGVWRVRVDSASHLPRQKTPALVQPRRRTSSGHYRCLKKTEAADFQYCFSAVLAVKGVSLDCNEEASRVYHRLASSEVCLPDDPTWKEEFEFLVARVDDITSGNVTSRLTDALGLASVDSNGQVKECGRDNEGACSLGKEPSVSTTFDEPCKNDYVQNLSRHLPPPEAPFSLPSSSPVSSSVGPTTAPAHGLQGERLTAAAWDMASRQLAFANFVRRGYKDHVCTQSVLACDNAEGIGTAQS